MFAQQRVSEFFAHDDAVENGERLSARLVFKPHERGRVIDVHRFRRLGHAREIDVHGAGRW